MAPKPLPPVSLLRQLLSYDAEEGRLRWRARTPDMFSGNCPAESCRSWNTRYAGQYADHSFDGRGYRRTFIHNVRYQTQRVVFKFVTGREPGPEVDHRNGDRGDNRIVNLRDSSRQANARNIGGGYAPKSGYRGVYAHRKRWRATCYVQGKCVHLGTFDTAEEAAEVRLRFSEEHGFSNRHLNKAA